MQSQSNDFLPDELRCITARFNISEPFEISEFPEKGNINKRTYLVRSNPSGETTEYILQQLNPEVLTQPRQLMNSMMACIRAQHRALMGGALRPGEEWEAVTLVPTRAGNGYLELDSARGREYWRLMVRIPNCVSYKNLNQITDPERRLEVAQQVGSGLGLFGGLTADMDPDGLVIPIPGYRNTRLYFDQFHSVLEGNRTREHAAPHLPPDPDLCHNTESLFLVHLTRQEHMRRMEEEEVRRCVHLAFQEESFAVSLFSELQAGVLQKAAIHGDTKLDNFLFSSISGKVKALVDLDTIMPYTWLADWGDMVRSLVNTAGETTYPPDRVEVDLQVFEAVARGFLGSARHIRCTEVSRMVAAVQTMAIELGVRFLTDYLRGDTYFKLDPEQSAELNKNRALVQFVLVQRLREKADAESLCIESLSREFGICL